MSNLAARTLQPLALRPVWPIEVQMVEGEPFRFLMDPLPGARGRPGAAKIVALVARGGYQWLSGRIDGEDLPGPYGWGHEIRVDCIVWIDDIEEAWSGAAATGKQTGEARA